MYFIFSYLVFLHLSGDNSCPRIREFHRILRPGGIAFLATCHQDIFNYLERLHNSSEIAAFAGGAFNAFRDLDRHLEVAGRIGPCGRCPCGARVL